MTFCRDNAYYLPQIEKPCNKKRKRDRLQHLFQTRLDPRFRSFGHFLTGPDLLTNLAESLPH